MSDAKKKTLGDFEVGQEITFKPGGRTKGTVTAKVTGFDGVFLTTEDSTGAKRKCRPGQVVD